MIVSTSHEYLEQILTNERSSFSKPWTEYHLNNIAVAKRFRENGTAIHPLKNMVSYLNDIKVKSVLLEVSSSNLPARKLYGKMGFVPQGERKNHYTKGVDSVLYTLEI